MTLDPCTLIGSRCRACGATTFPVRSACPDCRVADASDQVELERSGVLHTFTIVRQAPPGEQVPYGLGYVDLPPGVRVFSRLRASRLDDLEIGMTMALAERDMGTDDEGGALVGFQFEPSGGSDAQ